MDQEEGRNQ